MKRFATLFEALDTTTATNLKIAAMVAYFRAAPAADAEHERDPTGGSAPEEAGAGLSADA